MTRSPPLRFLAIVLGGWAALRTALLAPPWPAPTVGAVAAAAAPRRALANDPRGPGVEPAKAKRVFADRPRLSPEAGELAVRAIRRRPGEGIEPPFPPVATAMNARNAAARPGASKAPLPARPAAAAAPAKRWSLSAWSFVRRGDSPALAAGGLLGGSQAGVRFAYRLNRDPARPLALSFRLSAPLRRTAGAEAALGLDWRPDRRLPVHLLAERRQRLGGEGRSAFALTIYGGVDDQSLGPFRIDGYAQAGLVGARSRDPFADGALRVSIPLGGRTRLGAGAWAAAQPGLARLDLGPQAAIRLPVAGRAVTLAADWRLRVAGNAEPGSGPTLTLSSDF